MISSAFMSNGRQQSISGRLCTLVFSLVQKVSTSARWQYVLAWLATGEALE